MRDKQCQLERLKAMIKKAFTFFYKPSCSLSLIFTLLWLLIIYESSIPLSPSSSKGLELFPYQMMGNDLFVFEFRAGFLGDADAALKASEFYKEYGDKNTELYWIHKAAMLGSAKAEERLKSFSSQN